MANKLIKANWETKEKYHQEYRRIAFIVGSPLQALGASLIVVSNLFSFGSYLFFRHDFAGAKDLSQTIKNNGIFDQVIDVYPQNGNFVIRSANDKNKEPLAISTQQKEQLKGYKDLFDCICCSFPYDTAIELMNDKTKFIQLDDGVGTYVSDLFSTYSDNKSFSSPTHIVLFAASLYQQTHNNNNNTAKSSPKIISMPKEFLYSQAIKNSFECSKEIIQEYTKQDIIFLSQPEDNNDGIAGMNVAIIEELNELINNFNNQITNAKDNQNDNQKAKHKKQDKELLSFAVRRHPRDNHTYLNQTKQDNTSWEMICLNEAINDNTILCGIASTAQLMPKILNEKEPYLIFLYDIYQLRNKNLIAAQKTKELAETLYVDKTKIYVPSSIKQLETITKEILNSSLTSEKKIILNNTIFFVEHL